MGEGVTLGSRLAEARKRRGWSIREAERHAGLSNAHISQIETGVIKRPEAATLIRLADAYDLPAAEVLAMVGRAGETVVIEWGVRRWEEGREHWYGSDAEAERLARAIAADHAKSDTRGVLIRRTVTYGPWEPVPDFPDRGTAENGL